MLDGPLVVAEVNGNCADVTQCLIVASASVML